MNMHREVLSFAAVPLLAGLLSCGCGGPPKSSKPGYPRDVTFKLGDGFAKFHALDGTIALLVCCRYDGEERGGGLKQDKGGEWHDSFMSSTGRIDLSYAFQDSALDRVHINGKRYDPTKGHVFLLSLEKGNCRVVQLHRKLSGIAAEITSVTQFIEKDPDIAHFMKEWRLPESPAREGD